MTRIKGESKKLNCEYKKPDPIKNDGLFFDSYGNQVHHGSEIIIEHNYNYPHWNGQKAYVNWNTKQGIYQFQVEGSLSTIDNFWGIHSFRVLDAQIAQKNELNIPDVSNSVCVHHQWHFFRVEKVRQCVLCGKMETY